MEQLHHVLLILHIIAGAIGLCAGTINLIQQKSGQRHRVVGTIFFYAMLLVGFSAIVLAYIHPNSFLLIVGIFTIYMVGTGYRYARLRKRGKEVVPELVDWILGIGMGLTGIVFIATGAIPLFKGHFFGIVYLVFGLISLLFVRADVVNFRGKSSFINYWQTTHLQRMIGAYIASLTAFLVVNYAIFPAFFPGWLFWLLPSIILTPLIIIWSNKYGVKKQKA